MKANNGSKTTPASFGHRIVASRALIGMVGLLLPMAWLSASPSARAVANASAFTASSTPKPMLAPKATPAPKAIPTPTMVPTPANAGGLTEARKRSLGSLEMATFKTSLGNAAFVKETGNYKGQWYEIYKNNQDPSLAAKVAAVNRAVRLIADKGVKIPNGLRVYLTNEFAAQNRAFSRDENWKEVAYVVLGPAALEGGRADAFSASGFLGENKPTITTVHEIGHILHERSLGDAFWATGSIIAGTPSTGTSVTGYANSSKKEFVAEVFAGLILGKKWPTDVLNEYRRYSGPLVP
jgi:hypothetical protein